MAKRCKHLNTTVRYEPALSTSCDRCGEQLSLGPSNDEPSEVQVEMRAAEVEALLDTAIDGRVHAMEHVGWRLHERGTGLPLNPGNEAGWIAREIATHDDRATRDANAWSWDPTRPLADQDIDGMISAARPEIDDGERDASDVYDDSDHQPYCDSLKDCAFECNCSLADVP